MTRTREGVVGYRLPDEVHLEGVAGPAGQRPWLGLPLHERQDRALIEAGVRPTEEVPDPQLARIVMRADAAVTHHAVAALADRGAELGEDIRWVTGGRSGGFAEELGLGDSGPLLAWLAPGGPVTAARMAAARPVEFEPNERLFELPMPREGSGVDVLELPLT